MSLALSKSEIMYNKRLSEEDRQREIKRQQAYRDVKAQALVLRSLKAEQNHFYRNSNGGRVSGDNLTIPFL